MANNFKPGSPERNCNPSTFGIPERDAEARLGNHLENWFIAHAGAVVSGRPLIVFRHVQK
ncbi:hypothetical protein M407DRAFT_246937 [Tulasnella calospora MUT 4182]|uniref:Uncharacterized protein n=1 Tax=Tulasnella calospora MUT 4182 TaxID=1051891 RepID=A0A0C3K5L5_9AGAM|nr:hypothetical protein M407DRAFT_246937 [Tulasnella calospora MUT 4182]